MSVEDVFAKLDKKTLSLLRRGSDITKERIPTASLGLNNILGGGFPVGKQTTIYGNEQSTKSLTMMQTIAINQAAGLPCALVDAEHSFDYEWAARLGVDTDSLIVTQASTISEVTDLQIELIKAGIKLIVIDSTSALMPKSFFKEGEMKNFDNAGQIGQFAKDLGQMCVMVQGVNYDCSIVHISQIRMDLGNSFMPGTKASGGKAAEHTDSVRIKLFSSKSDKQAIMGQVQRGSKLIEERVGRKVKWSIEKNKVNGRYGSGDYDVYTLGDTVGIDRASEIVLYGTRYGLIEKTGAWFKIGEHKFHGEDNLLEFIRDDKGLQSELESEIAKASE